MNRNISVSYSGEGNISSVTLNGNKLEHTLQIPDDRLQAGDNRLDIKMENQINSLPCLVYSTIRLNDVSEENGIIVYNVQGYSQNVLVMKNVNREFLVFDSQNNPVPVTLTPKGKYLFAEFWGKGEYRVECRM
ncbi:MAG: hypothetical protein U5R06_07185 [candidate division KSB1 bacterium]|nr:hypothetical protein [candidate division KSB1 bacterium]